MTQLEKKPSILQIIPNLVSGGAEKTTLDIGRAIVSESWCSFVVSQGGRMVDELVGGGSTHITLPAASKNPIKIIQNTRSLIKIIREQNISIIHARSRAPAWSALFAAGICNIPFVTTYHGAYKQKSWFKELYNSVMVRSDVTIANSNWTADLIKSRYKTINKNIEVIYRGTDFSAYDLNSVDHERRQKLLELWNISDAQTIILNLARITTLKGQRTLIEAIPGILDLEPDAVIVFAGDDHGHETYRRELQNRCEELGITENVRFPGYCDDPAAAFAISELSIVASHQPETFGRAAVEAQALKSLVIVTDLGGAGETVLAPPTVSKYQRTGWKVPPKNAEAITNAVRSVLKLKQSEREDILDRARLHVEKSFSTERMCLETIQVYKSLLNSRQRSPNKQQLSKSP